ncbi:MAG TPA: hypothetical protein VF232_08630 [Gaiellaceae bacterium]
MTYLDELSQELAAHGIRGRTRHRILLEADDHLRSDSGAQQRFGSAREVANTFAAELGVQASRRAAVSAFAALGVAGAVYAVSVVSLGFASPPTEMLDPALGAIAFAVMIVAPQISFVAGTLALLRTLRRRRERVIPTRELVVIRRRTGVALLFGLLTMAALSLYAYEFRAELAAWWLTLTYTSTAGASVLLALAAAPALTATRLRPHVGGEAGDVFADVGPRFGDDPWRFGRLVAIAAGLLVWLAAAAQGDPFDGLVQGAFEGLACFGGFAVLGRYLGLRR